MILTITYKAKCKHCKKLGYYYPLKKDGNPSKLRKYNCSLQNKDVSPNDYVCEPFNGETMGNFGGIMPEGYK